MRSVLLAYALALATACGASAGSANAGPSATASPSLDATASSSPSPSHIPGSAVILTVNGRPAAVSQPFLATAELPTVLVLTFPVPMDRAGVERWLPREATVSWIDDRTLRLSFPVAQPFIGFKIPEAPSASGNAVVDLVAVDIRFPESRLVRVYSLGDLIGGTRAPTATTQVRVPAGDGLTVSPDGKAALVFDGFGPGDGPAPTLVDLPSGVRTSLPQPPASDGWFSYADWLPDGRLLMVGRGVWIGDGRGASMRRIADAQDAAGGYPWIAVPDPAGKRIAIWGYNADGHIAIVDLGDGTVRRLTGPFRRSLADVRVSLVWSADGARIAGTDDDAETGSASARVRVVDVASDRTVKTLEGNVIGLEPIANDLIVLRDSGQRGAGAPLLGQRTDFDLVEKARYLGCGWALSRDGRYLLQAECGGAGLAGYTLFDLQNGSTYGFGLPGGGPHWLVDGRLAYY